MSGIAQRDSMVVIAILLITMRYSVVVLFVLYQVEFFSLIVLYEQSNVAIRIHRSFSFLTNVVLRCS